MNKYVSLTTMKRLLLLLALLSVIDAHASQWIQRASIGGVGRHRGCGVGVGNRGYFGTGHFNGTGPETYFSDWWAYDPGTNAWTQKADYPGNNGNGELGCHCWAFEGKVYVGLGEVQHRVLFRYDPATNSWEQMANAPTGINFQDTQEMVLNEKAYFTNLIGNNLYVYDCPSNTWTLIGPLPVSWNFTFSAYTYDSKFWIKTDYIMYMYDPLINTWYQVVSAGTFPGTARRGSADFFVDGKFYVVGGHGMTYSTISSEVWEFDPINYTWTRLEDFEGSSRRYTKAFVLNGKAYVCTGTNGTNFNDVWEFNKYLGIEENDPLSFDLYPNPANEFVHINSASDLESVFLKDLNGKLVKEVKDSKIDVNDLPSGTYLIQISTPEGVVSAPKQLVKQ